MSSLIRRLERIEQSPYVQRERRLIHALQMNAFTDLSDADLAYLSLGFRTKYSPEFGERLDAWVAALSDAEVEAVVAGRWDDLSDGARQSLAELEAYEQSDPAN